MEDTVAVSTPSEGTAAPAASAAPSTPTPSQRPTFEQAFASDAARPTTIDAAQPEAPTTQAAEAVDVASATNPSTDKTGPIPFEVHKTALDNARTKARAEVEAELGWAKNIDRATVTEGARIGHLYQTDKPAFIREILAEAMTSPELAPLVRSEAARALGTKVATPPSVPDVEILDAQGQVVGNLREIVQKLSAEMAAKEIAPYKQDLSARQERERAQQEHAKLEKSVSTTYQRAMSSLPQFKEHEAEIAAAMKDIPTHDDAGEEIDPLSAVQMAWAKVVTPERLAANAQKKVLDDLKTKAGAQGMNPSAAPVATTRRPRSLTDSSLQW